jgi:hypothetical protein
MFGMKDEFDDFTVKFSKTFTDFMPKKVDSGLGSTALKASIIYFSYKNVIYFVKQYFSSLFFSYKNVIYFVKQYFSSLL